jgi:hypothetical protein
MNKIINLLKITAMKRIITYQNIHRTTPYPNTLKLACLALCILGVNFLFAQGNFDLVETYTLEVKNVYEKPGNRKLEDFHITDRLYFKPQKEVIHITNTLDAKDNYVTTMIHERPEHFEKWMKHPAKTVIASGEITLYDSNNNVMLKEKISKEKEKEIKDIVKEIRKSGKAQKVNFDAADLVEVAKNKGQYKKLSFYSEEIEYDSLIYRNLPEKLAKQFVKKENGKPIESHALKYAKVKGQEDHFFKTSKTMKKIKLQDSLGKEAEIIQSDEINCFNYKVNKSNMLVARNLVIDQSLFMSIAENPVSSNYLGLKITAQADQKDNTYLKLYIYNSVGQMVKEATIDPTITQHSIDLESMPSGTYFIKGTILDQKQTLKFIKL